MITSFLCWIIGNVKMISFFFQTKTKKTLEEKRKRNQNSPDIQIERSNSCRYSNHLSVVHGILFHVCNGYVNQFYNFIWKWNWKSSQLFVLYRETFERISFGFSAPTPNVCVSIFFLFFEVVLLLSALKKCLRKFL